MQDPRLTFTFSETNKERIRSTFQNGGIIAYPTEAVFGLGCDPFNEHAVRWLLSIKQRSEQQGVILIASDWQQFKHLIGKVPTDKLEKVHATWPGPVTWLFPPKPTVPTWISGIHGTVAIRLTAHPIARAICDTVGQVIVSTSANLSGEPPCRTEQEVQQKFADKIDLLIPGLVGDLENPTEIRDVMTGKVLRAQ